MFKKILLSLLLLTTLLSATAPTQDSVTKLYVATFDRAPDAKGLAYWLDDSGLTLEQIAMSFFDQDETQVKYPLGTATSLFVETVYTNLFNRTPDAAGLEYWVVELDSDRISRSVFILAVINGALGDDAVILDHKMEVGLYFAEKGLDDADDAIRVMADITGDPATVVAAKKLIDEIAAGKDLPSTSTLKKTGQTTVNADFDDGYYQSGVTPSYTRDNDIVKDNITGLEWQDDIAVKTVYMTWDEANSYCTSLPLAGGGWRLPTSIELEGIVDYSRVSPSINTSYFQNTNLSNYWSSTIYAGYKHAAWFVFFFRGDAYDGDKENDYAVRCVRVGE